MTAENEAGFVNKLTPDGFSAGVLVYLTRLRSAIAST